jgi:hypothetical protein
MRTVLNRQKTKRTNQFRKLSDSVLNLFAALCLSKRHIESDSRHYRLPGFVFRQTASFDRAPQVNNFFFRDGLEKVLVSFSV